MDDFRKALNDSISNKKQGQWHKKEAFRQSFLEEEEEERFLDEHPDVDAVLQLLDPEGYAKRKSDRTFRRILCGE